jgi:accessory gene regulator B
MKTKFTTFCINFITKYNNYSEKDLDKIRYGLEGLYLTISKLVIIFTIALFLGILLDLLIIIVFYNFLRFFGFGFHADKSWQCLIISITMFNVLPFLFLNIDISLFYTLLISIICCISFIIFAPADTKKRPLKNKRKRQLRKLGTFTLGIIYALIAIFYLPLRNYLLVALILETIGVLPVLYLMTGQSYNNYKLT